MHPTFSYTIDEIRRAFRETRQTGNRLLEHGQLTWAQYSEIVIGFELALHEAQIRESAYHA